MALNDGNFNNDSMKQAVVNAERSGAEPHEPDLLNDVEIRQDSQQLKAQEHGKIHEDDREISKRLFFYQLESFQAIASNTKGDIPLFEEHRHTGEARESSQSNSCPSGTVICILRASQCLRNTSTLMIFVEPYVSSFS